MAKIKIYRSKKNANNLKPRLRRHRKRMAREALKYREMYDDFSQLSLVDETRIGKRAEIEARKIKLSRTVMFPNLVKRRFALELAHKYTKELLGTVAV